MRDIFSDESRFESWLRVEVALSKSLMINGFYTESIHSEIQRSAKIENLDLNKMKEEYDRIGFPISPFVHQLAKSCNPEASKWIHWGATTQDVIDSGLVLQMRKGLKVIDNDVQRIIILLSSIVKKSRSSIMIGRTFMQQAAPITFGFKAAIWLDECLRHFQKLDYIKDRLFTAQLGGAVGNLATFGSKGLNVRREFCNELNLKEPEISWHTSRDIWAEIIFWNASFCATFSKIATEISILMRTEVNELREGFAPGRGSSSTMPQKRNPIFAPPIIAISNKSRELVSSQLTAMIQEHERSVATQPLEWLIIPESFLLISGSLKHMKNLLENLEIDENKMKSNFQNSGGFLMAESVMMGLAKSLGKLKSHQLVASITVKALKEKKILKDALVEDELIRKYLSINQIDDLLNPSSYLGETEKMIEAILKKSESINLQNELD